MDNPGNFAKIRISGHDDCDIDLIRERQVDEVQSQSDVNPLFAGLLVGSYLDGKWWSLVSPRIREIGLSKTPLHSIT